MNATVAATHVVVQPGDWLSSIAPKYGETWPQLYDDNKAVVGSDPNLIYPGQVLVVHPGTGKRRAASAPAAPTVHSSAQVQAAAPSGASRAALAAVAYEKTKIGDPYQWGGNGPNAFDCSGLAQQAYRHAGISIPRTADAQMRGLPHVSLSHLLPGDLIFFGYSSAYADHVAMYVGNGMIIDTSSHRPNGGVGEQSLSSRWAGGAWHPIAAARPSSGGRHAATPAAAPAVHAPAALATVVSSGSPQQLAAEIFGSQASCADSIITRESGWSVTATNPSSGAYGLPQSLPGDKMAAAGPDWRTSPATQLRWMKSYVDSVYGGACNAWAHWQSAGSY